MQSSSFFFQRNKKAKESGVEQDRKPSVATGVPVTASVQRNDKITTEEPSHIILTVANQADNTPPSREDGFGMFKAEQGLALNKIFVENKGMGARCSSHTRGDVNLGRPPTERP